MYSHVGKASDLFDDRRGRQALVVADFKEQGPAGFEARNAAVAAITPIVAEVVERVGAERARAALPVLRELRLRLSDVD